MTETSVLGYKILLIPLLGFYCEGFFLNFLKINKVTLKPPVPELSTAPTTKFKIIEEHEAMRVMNRCYAKYNTSSEKLVALYLESNAYREMNAKCAILCMLTYFEIVDKEGNFLQRYTKEEMRLALMQNPLGEEYLNYLNKCSEKNDTLSACENAFNVVKCHGGQRFLGQYLRIRKIAKQKNS